MALLIIYVEKSVKSLATVMEEPCSILREGNQFCLRLHAQSGKSRSGRSGEERNRTSSGNRPVSTISWASFTDLAIPVKLILKFDVVHPGPSH
jgi:hypothetical protein